MRKADDILWDHATIMEINDDGTNGQKLDVLEAMQEYAEEYAIEFYLYSITPETSIHWPLRKSIAEFNKKIGL